MRPFPSSWLFVLAATGAAAEAPAFRLPVACAVGQTCLVQNHVDRDPSPAASDFQCGTLTYDEHTGTDFRIPSLAEQRAGVDVLAAAAGRVLRVRDGVPDVSVRERGRAAVQDAECGNGLVIAHAGGFETQYCHMAQGSLAVRPGDAVEAGRRLGRIGLSGLTEYPHLHFTVRHEGKVVDPFAFEAPPDSCGGGRALWDAGTRQALSYRPGAVLNRGFATGPVTLEEIEAGEAGRNPPESGAPALVAFVRAIGLKGGDVQVLTLTAPDGRTLAASRSPPLDRAKAQVMVFAGVRRPAAGWPPGLYRAGYQVLRDGKPVLDESFTHDLPR